MKKSPHEIVQRTCGRDTLIKPNKKLWLVLCAISASILALDVEAASFDCAKASTKVEHIICDSPEITKLDEELAQNYKGVSRINLILDFEKER